MLLFLLKNQPALIRFNRCKNATIIRIPMKLLVPQMSNKMHFFPIIAQLQNKQTDQTNNHKM
jgi:hypothetical protein